MLKIMTFGLSVICVLTAIWFWSKETESTLDVSAVSTKLDTIESRIQVAGRVTTKRKVVLASVVVGEITEIHVKENDVVSAGQVLLRLDDRKAVAEVKLAEASLLQVREEYLQAERKLEHKRKLFDLGGISLDEIEDAKTDVLTAKARIDESSQKLEIAKLDLDKYTIKAPFSGVITRSEVYQGQRVYLETELLELVDLDALEVEAEVDAVDIGLIRLGQKAMVSSDSLPGKIWLGEVAQLGSAVRSDETEKTNDVLVSMSISTDLSMLRMGEQVDIDVTLASRQNTLVLPFNAVLARDGNTLVALAEDGRVRYRKVVTGIESLTHTEILQGLEEGQNVLVLYGEDVSEGTEVRLTASKSSM